MDLIRADAHLGAKTISHPVGKPRRRVPVDACAVDGGHECFGGGGGGRDDAVRVVGAVGVDVCNCEVEAGVFGVGGVGSGAVGVSGWDGLDC